MKQPLPDNFEGVPLFFVHEVCASIMTPDYCWTNFHPENPGGQRPLASSSHDLLGNPKLQFVGKKGYGFWEEPTEI